MRKWLNQNPIQGTHCFFFRHWSILSFSASITCLLITHNIQNTYFKWCVSRIGSWSTTNSNWYPLGQIIKCHGPNFNTLIYFPNSVFSIWENCLILNYVLNHICQLVKSCFLHLRNIVRISPSLNHKDAETVIQAFITSRLGYVVAYQLNSLITCNWYNCIEP